MIKYTKTKSLKITDIQDNTLKKLDSLGINVAKFMRDAISEKLQREHKNLISKPKKQYCPF